MTEKIRSNNNIYTKECKNLYDNLRFAHIKKVKLWSEILYYICGFFSVVVIAIISSYIIPSFFREERNLVTDILSTTLIVVFVCIIVVSIVCCVKSYNKNSHQFYIIKSDAGEYQLDVNNIDGRLYIKYIADVNNRIGLSVEDRKCAIYNWNERGVFAEDIGFYQYIVSPTRVFLRYKLRETDRRLYKKKTVIGNNTYYRFHGFGGVVGARFSRCIKLQKGIIKYITTQDTNGARNTNGKLIFSSYKYIYDNVNDGSLKIYIPRFAMEYAIEHKFVLPLQCDNLICEE